MLLPNACRARVYILTSFQILCHSSMRIHSGNFITNSFVQPTTRVFTLKSHTNINNNNLPLPRKKTYCFQEPTHIRLIWIFVSRVMRPPFHAINLFLLSLLCLTHDVLYKYVFAYLHLPIWLISWKRQQGFVTRKEMIDDFDFIFLMKLRLILEKTLHSHCLTL